MLLDVRNLSVFVDNSGISLELIHAISLSLDAGKVLAIVGESGSGKTTLLKALTRLFPDHVSVTFRGSVFFQGTELMGKKDNSGIDRKKIRYVFQEPAAALNPLLKIKTQFRLLDIREQDAESILTQTGIDEPERVLRSYPHELSGGMAQRVVIALALYDQPQLILADEPTSAVDANLKFQILDLLNAHCRNTKAGMIMATHDLAVAKQYADSIAVIYAGRIVEISQDEEFFNTPLHPYSKMLVEAIGAGELPAITVNEPPSVDRSRAFTGNSCSYATRCDKFQPDCMNGEPALQPIENQREVRCLYWK